MERSAMSVCRVSSCASLMVVGALRIEDNIANRSWIFAAAVSRPTMDAVTLNGSTLWVECYRGDDGTALWSDWHEVHMLSVRHRIEKNPGRHGAKEAAEEILKVSSITGIFATNQVGP